ncbi:hydrogenase-4 subunit E [Leptospira idonii]|uniref:Hydrogenase-4 subunit E n=1 Tax=Leptospira idonii TaxID=1193500 RepID=A0A4R9LXA9_9LEPT|nr:hydrogenase-4 subunit E [Leptospira idonii]TGN17880.1 hydrogenase-4 subunit E [Leptospira idonii]
MFKKPTGVYFSKEQQSFYEFISEDNQVTMQSVAGKKSPIDFLMDESYPVWLLRHSLGKDMGEENYSSLSEEDYITDKRNKVLGLHQKSGVLKDLNFRGLKVPCSDTSYSHAVGPIHAGIIEPGHFRFVVEGETVRHLTIRLGFQKRDIQDLIKSQSPERVMHFSETISGDTSVAYATAFSRIYEKAAGISLSKDVEIFRSLLLETERIAIHIGDLGGLSEDIGYYPLFGVCATDRGAALGLMETWTGNRFGKAAVRPGGVRTNQRISAKDAKLAFGALKKIFLKNVQPQIERALKDSTIKERLQGCGTVSEENVHKHGFVGQVARMAGIPQDLRLKDAAYPNWKLLPFKEEHHHFSGDAWARFYLRYREIQQSLEWMETQIESLDWEKLWSPEQVESTYKKLSLTPGIHFEAVEGWRGPVLVALEIGPDGSLVDSYIRDPSVLNWHALELAIRGELIGDFPLNNKSFNLSYVGFDL